MVQVHAVIGEREALALAANAIPAPADRIMRTPVISTVSIGTLFCGSNLCGDL